MEFGVFIKVGVRVPVIVGVDSVVKVKDILSVSLSVDLPLKRGVPVPVSLIRIGLMVYCVAGLRFDSSILRGALLPTKKHLLLQSTVPYIDFVWFAPAVSLYVAVIPFDVDV